MTEYFYEVESQIGIKRLTAADLGIGGTSRQTHIGLYADVLTFLPDSDVVRGMLICGSGCEVLDCYFDRIENPDGSFRSPKIRMGSDGNASVVSEIRRIVVSGNAAEEWYLVWAGIDNKDIAFWLVSNESLDFALIKTVVAKGVHVLSPRDDDYESLLLALTDKINEASFGIQKEMEIASQVGDGAKKFKPIDLAKALKRYSEIGKAGEELISEYLDAQVGRGCISSFEWMNRSRESGMPYDFRISQLAGIDLFVDVKSTAFDFAQRIVFSSQEVEFVSTVGNDDAYAVYRIFGINDGDICFRTCNRCLSFMNDLNDSVKSFRDGLSLGDVRLHSMALSVSPNTCFAGIGEVVKL